jgi:hypothetical protein
VSKIADDLQQHFADQLRQLLLDTTDTMERVDIPHKELCGLLLASLMREVVIGSYSLRMDENTFTGICRVAYRKMEPTLRKAAADCRRKRAATTK